MARELAFSVCFCGLATIRGFLHNAIDNYHFRRLPRLLLALGVVETAITSTSLWSFPFDGVERCSLSLHLVVVWLLDLDIVATTGTLVVSPPGVMEGGCTIHGPLNVTIVWRSVPAGPTAPPPVLAVRSHLIVEAVIDLKRGGVSREG